MKKYLEENIYSVMVVQIFIFCIIIAVANVSSSFLTQNDQTDFFDNEIVGVTMIIDFESQYS